MIASFWSTGNGNVVNTLSNLLAIPTLVSLVLLLWHFWHSRCHEPLCVRPGEVPIEGDVHKLCCRHAADRGLTH